MYVDVSWIALVRFEHQFMHGRMNGGGSKFFSWEPEVVIFRLGNIDFEQVFLKNWVNDEMEWFALG